MEIKDTKNFSSVIEIKQEPENLGEFQAIFSRFNVIDKDGDVTLPGAFTDGQKVKIAYWGHRWNDLPVGVGVIHADSEKAWVDGRFFTDTESGMETYKTVKNLGELQEWSYGFSVLESEQGEFDGKPVRFLKKLDVYEISPVLIGAGVGTTTTSLKSNNPTEKCEDEAVANSKSSAISVEDWKLLFQILTNIGE